MLASFGALRLRYLTGPQRGAFAVLRPPRSRIGRSRDNDIVLPDHQGAESSAHHAEALREGRQWWIHDLQSTNGTLLNGAPVTRAQFGPGDRLRFGDVELEVVPPRASAASVLLSLTAIVAFAAVSYTWMGGGSRSFESIASDVSRSVFLVALEAGGTPEIIGTSFVVGDRLLATNAHVAAALESRQASPRTAIVIRNDSGEVQQVARVHISPSWRRNSIAHDVALLAVIDLPEDAVPLRLADDATIASLTRGASVATFGFPAVSTEPMRPRGRLAIDVIGDVRDGQYLAVGLGIAPGMSGSPIFLNDGVVAGLVAGGDFTVAPTGERIPSGTNLNWGISVAPLRQLLRESAARRR